jgi:ATP-dependent Zn protease
LNPRLLRNGVVTLVLIVATLALAYMFVFPGSNTQTIPYSGGDDSFLGYVRQGRVEKVVPQGSNLEITLKGNDPSTKAPIVKRSKIPNQFATDVRRDIVATCAEPGASCNPDDIKIIPTDPPETGQLLGLLITGLMPVILIGVFLFFMIRRAEVTSAQGITGGPGGGARPPPAAAEQPVTVDIPDQIRKLAELRDEGILTPEEFAAKKAELLKRM